MRIKINGKTFRAKQEKTVLDIAKSNNIDIPALCYHSDLPIKANCRLCLVEIKDLEGLHTSCSTPIVDGMEITTQSPALKKARKTNLELLFAQHIEQCGECIYLYNCYLLKLAKEYGVKIMRFADRKKNYPKFQFGNSIVFDSSKCIDCRNCVDVCEKQGIGFLEIQERGHLFKVVPSRKKSKDCIYCGQCITHCPVGAFEGVGEFEDIEKPFKDKKKTVVFQFAPAIRATLGEEFGMPYGTVVTEKMAAAIKKLGADKVFDVCLGADITTIEEAKELIDRLKSKKPILPMFTSCCPGWVKYVEFYHPELIPNLTTVRSPHIILGGLIKTYWAKEENLRPKDIVVVSIMPCTAKKEEIERKMLKIKGLKPVDYVLTTRELAYLLKKKKIDLKNIEPEPVDSPLGIHTGAGVIYGASGGVMESALRTAHRMITGRALRNVEFKQVRGFEGFKKADIKIKNTNLKVAVVNGIENAKKLIEELKVNPRKYQYIEVMACFGGCIGGGGQPLPVNAEIRVKRAQALLGIDKKKSLRCAEDNPIVQRLYKDFFKSKRKVHKLCHTHFKKQKAQSFKKIG